MKKIALTLLLSSCLLGVAVQIAPNTVQAIESTATQTNTESKTLSEWFPDETVRDSVWWTLRVQPTTKISLADLEKVTQLDAGKASGVSGDVSTYQINLEGVQYLKNLERFSYYGQITDLTPLLNLKKLDRISVDYVGDVNDLLPLKVLNITGLEANPAYNLGEMWPHWYNFKEFKHLEWLHIGLDEYMDGSETEIELNYLRAYMPNTEVFTGGF